MDKGRWTTVTESSFDHERAGLEAIRERLPNVDPWYAWSNFTFTANTGHIREVDLLVIAPNGVHMIELKDWSGKLVVENGTWVQLLKHGGRRPHHSPLHLVNQKSKELAGLIGAHGHRLFMSACVCFTNSDLRFHVPTGDRVNTHTITELLKRLTAPAVDTRDIVDAQRAKAIKRALEKVGIRRSDAEFKVGPYLLKPPVPFDTGPTWQDYLGKHNELNEEVRVRIYLQARGSDEQTRKSVYEAAKREADVLNRFRHPGVVQLTMFDPSAHSAGPALLFRYNPATLHLDDYLSIHGERLDMLDRAALVRQLAETLKSAHSARLYHRSLAARSIHVIPRPGDSDAERWSTPRLQISDWQAATRRPRATAHPTSVPAPSAGFSVEHLAEDSKVYLAPEVSAPNPDPIAMDVYGLGMLTYLLTTGRPPAATRADMLARFHSDDAGLRPGPMLNQPLDDLDLLVETATAFQPGRRLTSIDEFLELLDDVEDALTKPDEVAEPEPDKNPLDAKAGDLIAGRWQVLRRLGTGSTSRALLVRDLQADSTKRGSRPFAVLKIALDDRNDILAREAEVLSRLRRHTGVINLLPPDTLTLAGRTVLVVEYVGDEQGLEDSDQDGTRRRTEETVGRRLRDDGRLNNTDLADWGKDLFDAVDFLEGEGVWHRDIKPDNIAIRRRPNRTREIVLIDFSLAGYSVQRTDAGTEGYLDPFIGGLTRSVYDAHAEYYAVAVTLHEMASRELPKWGDGSQLPTQLDDETPTLAADAFDPAIRDDLIAFFRIALHRDKARRFADLKQMRDAWHDIFRKLDQAKPSRPPSLHPADEPLSAEEERARIAEQVTRSTHLSAAGLSPTAEQFLYGLGLNTVNDLIVYGQRQLVNAPGLGARIRREIQDRQKEWTRRLGEAQPLADEDRQQARDEIAAAEATLDNDMLRIVSLDTLATRFVPARNNNGANAAKVEVAARLLRIPARGDHPDLPIWPSQTEVAATLDITGGRVGQLVKALRQQWKKDHVVTALRNQVLDILNSFGRVASADEIADALTGARPCRLYGRDERHALALAAVRVVVERENLLPDEAELAAKASRDGSIVVLALEAGGGADTQTPSAPSLLDYAFRLGKVADELAAEATLPTAASVLERLGTEPLPAGDPLAWDERRIVAIAVGASRTAAATPRLEIYPRDLDLVRAIRLTQAGLVRWIPDLPAVNQPGLEPREINDRIRARFPKLTIDPDGSGLPTGEPLTKALRDAGFNLTLATREPTRTLRYLTDQPGDISNYTDRVSRRDTFTAVLAATRYSDDPDIAAAALTEDRLAGSAERDGFRVLTVAPHAAHRTITDLAERFTARSVSVTALFLAALHELVPPGGKPTWHTILEADAAVPGSKAAARFGNYAVTAWSTVRRDLAARLTLGSPLLLTDTLAFARYHAMDILGELAQDARHGRGALWLLCPQADPLREPRLGRILVTYEASRHEWISLPEPWTRNLHRTQSTPDSPATGATA